MLKKYGFVIGLIVAIIIPFLLGKLDKTQPFQIIGNILAVLVSQMLVTSIYCLFKGYANFDSKFGKTSLVLFVLTLLNLLYFKLFN